MQIEHQSESLNEERRNEPWLDHPEIWKTKSSFMSWLRGGIRRSLWNKSPIKIEFIKKNRKKIANPNPKGRVKEVWGATCAECHRDFPLKDIQVDHKIGNHPLKEISDVQSFIESIVLVSDDDLQFLCSNDHKNKTYAEKNRISIKEAKAIREAILITKSNEDKQWLISHGEIPESTKAKRRKQIEEMLKGDISD